MNDEGTSSPLVGEDRGGGDQLPNGSSASGATRASASGAAERGRGSCRRGPSVPRLGGCGRSGLTPSPAGRLPASLRLRRAGSATSCSGGKRRWRNQRRSSRRWPRGWVKVMSLEPGRVHDRVLFCRQSEGEVESRAKTHTLVLRRHPFCDDRRPRTPGDRVCATCGILDCRNGIRGQLGSRTARVGFY